MNDRIEKSREKAYRDSEANIAAGGTAAKVADTIGTAAVAALPQAVTALMSAGSSLGATGAQGLETAAIAAQQSPGVLNSLRSAAAGLADNPNYWTSFLRTAGESYEQAKADGASDGKASLYAMGNGLLNAAVEVGGGLETLPEELQSGSSVFRRWLRSSAEEGAEEPIQGVIERELQNVVYDKNNPLWSTNNAAAVFSPTTAAKEFGVGTAVGGILGAGQTAAANIQQHGIALGEAAKRLISNENIARYRTAIDAVFSGNYPSGKTIQIGETPEILLQYGASQHPLTMKQSTAYKIAYPQGYFGGQHNLGMSVLKQLPYQVIDPIAILRSNTQDNSLVLLTQWKDGDKDVIIPIHLDSQGTVEIENKIASAYGTGHIDSYIGKNGSNVLYTKNGEDIHQLLSKGVQFPQAMADDILARDSVVVREENVKSGIWSDAVISPPNAIRPFSGAPQDYAALLQALARSRHVSPPLTPEQRELLEKWNGMFPEMRMDEEEFLNR